MAHDIALCHPDFTDAVGRRDIKENAMTSATVHAPQDQPDKASRPPTPAERSASPDPSPAGCSDIADLLCDVNASNEDIENQCLRARHAADISDRSEQEARRAQAGARTARVAHSSIQAERPQRRAPLPRQWLIAFLMVGLDGLACYFAAQALDGGEDSTLVWGALFLAALAGGEVALDFYRDRSIRAWRMLTGLLGAFVVVLGVLRFSFLATIGTGGLIPALAGAGLFTAATAGFLFLGYRALRSAETPQAWRARRRAQAVTRAARAAEATAKRDATERDHLIDAYLGQIRRLSLRTRSAGEQLAVEAAVRAYLLGKDSP